MIYKTGKEWLDAPSKRLLVFGMSGLGKTHVSKMLRDAGGWFHYSVDYRIGTRYMGEHIVDNFKAHAMQDTFLSELLRSDSIYLASNITFDNLAPLSTYLGKPGDPAKGGLPFEEYQRRQMLHHKAEVAALLDTSHFISRAKSIYGYDNFVCDTSGSICEVVDPWNAEDPVLSQLSQTHLMVWIESNAAHRQSLIDRFDRAPKPMCYAPDFLSKCWVDYQQDSGQNASEIDPDAFVRWTYARALEHRQPRYQEMATRWGISVSADEIAAAQSPDKLKMLIARKLDQ